MLLTEQEILVKFYDENNNKEIFNFHRNKVFKYIFFSYYDKESFRVKEIRIISNNVYDFIIKIVQYIKKQNPSYRHDDIYFTILSYYNEYLLELKYGPTDKKRIKRDRINYPQLQINDFLRYAGNSSYEEIYEYLNNKEQFPTKMYSYIFYDLKSLIRCAISNQYINFNNGIYSYSDKRI